MKKEFCPKHFESLLDDIRSSLSDMHNYVASSAVELAPKYDEAFFDCLRIYREFLNSVEFRKNDIYDSLQYNMDQSGRMDFDEWTAHFHTLGIPLDNPFYECVTSWFDGRESNQVSLSEILADSDDFQFIQASRFMPDK